MKKLFIMFFVMAILISSVLAIDDGEIVGDAPTDVDQTLKVRNGKISGIGAFDFVDAQVASKADYDCQAVHTSQTFEWKPSTTKSGTYKHSWHGDGTNPTQK